MDPTIALHTEIDLLDQSPLIRAMVRAISYAQTHDGIGLTQSGAMNRKFVTWAVDAFDWPGYSAKELYTVNKVFNEHDMPPLWPVHALLKHFKLLRRSKGTLKATKAGLKLAGTPGDLFNHVAPVYLYRFNHTPYCDQSDSLHHFWHVFLNVLNLEAAADCSVGTVLKVLYGWEQADRYDPEYNDKRHLIRLNVLRPLYQAQLIIIYLTALGGSSVRSASQIDTGYRARRATTSEVPPSTASGDLFPPNGRRCTAYPVNQTRSRDASSR